MSSTSGSSSKQGTGESSSGSRQSVFMDKMRKDLQHIQKTIVEDDTVRLPVDAAVSYTGSIKRRLTMLENQIFGKMDVADQILQDVPDEEEDDEDDDEPTTTVVGEAAATEGSPKKTTTKTPKTNLLPEIDHFIPKIENAIFVGHLVTDLDSIAGAIGAAALYNGTPASASEVNSETAYALKRFNVPTPKRIEDILKERKDAGKDNDDDDELRICLIDHQQTNQMNPAIPPKNVVGIIDHHALQNKTVQTSKPIYCNLRPWGSASSIIGHEFIMQKRRPSVKVAGMLLCAILSDTLNLQSPTTTEWDRIMVAALADLANIDDIDLLAVEQFRAKSQELQSLSAYSLVNGDQKTFTFAGVGEVGYAVIETTDDDTILARVHELVPEMVAAKAEKNLDLIFLAVVNIVKLKSQLVLCGAEETSLAEQAYGGQITEEGNLMDLGGLVSRKREFIPGLATAIEAGWKPSKEATEERVSLEEEVKQGAFGRLEVDPNDPHNQVQRVGCKMTKRRPSEFLLTRWHSVR